MVEVFKTNVIEQRHAAMLVDEIHRNFVNYKANFDLEDCDKILRVKCTKGQMDSSVVINLLKDLGFSAAILPDEIPMSFSQP